MDLTDLLQELLMIDLYTDVFTWSRKNGYDEKEAHKIALESVKEEVEASKRKTRAKNIEKIKLLYRKHAENMKRKEDIADLINNLKIDE